MNNFTFSIVVLLNILISIGCSKSKNNGPVNVNLIDKNPLIIESYIAGRWEMKFYKIGFTQTTVKVQDSTFWDFDFRKDSVYLSLGNVLKERYSIQWVKTPNHITGGGFYYVMNIHNGYPGYGVERIFNDTLCLFDPGPDGNGYYFIKK